MDSVPVYCGSRPPGTPQIGALTSGPFRIAAALSIAITLRGDSKLVVCGILGHCAIGAALQPLVHSARTEYATLLRTRRSCALVAPTHAAPLAWRPRAFNARADALAAAALRDGFVPYQWFRPQHPLSPCLSLFGAFDGAKRGPHASAAWWLGLGDHPATSLADSSCITVAQGGFRLPPDSSVNVAEFYGAVALLRATILFLRQLI